MTGLFTSRKDENATRPSILTQLCSQAVFLLVPGRRVGENPENKVDSHLAQLKCISDICWMTGRWTWAGVFYKQSYSAHSLPSWPVVKAKKEDNRLEKYIHRNLSMKGFDHRFVSRWSFRYWTPSFNRVMLVFVRSVSVEDQQKAVETWWWIPKWQPYFYITSRLLKACGWQTCNHEESELF